MAKAQGAPVEWKPMPYVPVQAMVLAVPSNAPHSNAGRLFAAWLVTEGMQIMEKMEGLSLVTNPDAAATQKIKKAVPDAPIVYPKSLAEDKLVGQPGNRLGSEAFGYKA